MNHSLRKMMPKILIKSGLFKVSLLGLFLPMLLAARAAGAVILWDAAATTVNINDPTQVLNNGTLITSYNAAGVSPTLNGFTFQANGPTAVSHLAYDNGFPTGSATTPYSSILTLVLHLNNSSATTNAMVLGGLTIGQTYELQLWTGYYITADTVRFSASAPDGAAVSNAPNQSPSLSSGSGPGQFVVGTFVADATTQNFYYYGDNSGFGGEIAAFQLRAIDPVPEPQTWALAGLGVSAICFRLRRKRRAV